MPAKQKIIRAAACQVLTSDDVAASARTVVEWIRRAAEQKIRLVAFPEGCLHGYTPDMAFWRKARPATFHRAEDKIARACRKYRIAAVVGSAHQKDGDWMNSLAIIDQRGRLIGRYSKTFLAGEKWCRSGRDMPIYNLLGVPCCFIICHDIRYPELVRLPTVRGAQLCIFCSCESPLTLEHKLSAYRAMPISRAAENGIWLLMANTPADPNRMDADGQSHGNSKIIDPDGNVVREAGYFEQGLIAADIDIAKANRWIAQRVVTCDSPIQDWVQAGTLIVRARS
jgi:omega-amidase